MIKAVFFDLYNTLARFEPPREELQQKVCREFGIEVTKEGIVKGYAVADNYMVVENARSTISKRAREERRHFFGEYERKVLQGAGVDVAADVALDIFKAIQKIPYDLAPFDDSAQCLEAIKERKLNAGLITNIFGDIQETCNKLGLSSYLDVAVTSEEVQLEKPHPSIFRAALQKAGVEPAEAVHVGDQYNSDVVGARGVGMTPILIDRDGLQNHVNDCIKVSGLMEVLDYLQALVLLRAV